jgi:hypothetical protein
MDNTITYYTNTPHIHRKFSEVLESFRELSRAGEPPKILREYFLKDELLALLLWYAEKVENAEGEPFRFSFADYEEVTG